MKRAQKIWTKKQASKEWLINLKLGLKYELFLNMKSEKAFIIISNNWQSYLVKEITW